MWPSAQSRAALNAANFFLGDMTSMVMPFLGTFLRNLWVRRHGSGRPDPRPQYPALPEASRHPGSGTASAFFAPSLGALALALVGRERLGRKATLAVGLAVLPLRIALYALARTTHTYLAVRRWPGSARGSTASRSWPSAPARSVGAQAPPRASSAPRRLAQPAGGVVGPVAAGALVQRLGSDTAFLAFAVAATVAGSCSSSAYPRLAWRRCVRASDRRTDPTQGLRRRCTRKRRATRDERGGDARSTGARL